MKTHLGIKTALKGIYIHITTLLLTYASNILTIETQATSLQNTYQILAISGNENAEKIVKTHHERKTLEVP